MTSKFLPSLLMTALLAGAGLSPALAADGMTGNQADALNGCAPAISAAALQAFAAQLDTHWNARDASALAAQYQANASFGLSSENVHRKGAPAIRQFFADSFQTMPPGLVHTTQARDAHMIGNLCALDTRATIGQQQADGKHKTLMRFAGYWLLQAGPKGLEVAAVRAVQLPNLAEPKS